MVVVSSGCDLFRNELWLDGFRGRLMRGSEESADLEIVTVSHGCGGCFLSW